MIATTLRAGLGINEASLKEALVGHLAGRLDDLDETISRAESSLFGAIAAPHLRVAAYDRAGLGGSAPAPGLATIDRQIDDLASVITRAGGRILRAGRAQLERLPGPAAPCTRGSA
jgi:hypothetical protein